MADYDLLQEVTVGTKPREAKETEGSDVDHSSVAKAVEHGRADTLGPSGAMHLQRMAGNAAMGALVQRKASGEQEEGNGSPVHDVIGKGGGSSLDTAKVADLVATHPAAIMDYVNPPVGEGRKPPSPLQPLLAIPTTAGTGSEATTVAILDIPDQRTKSGI